MAWGIWRKIGNGLKKLANGVVKGATFVNDKIVTPFMNSNAGKAVLGLADGVSEGLGSRIRSAVQKGQNIATSIAHKQRPDGRGPISKISYDEEGSSDGT
jgi:hypothetical protein